MDAREKIGTRISELRKARKITQSELADMSGVGRTHISRIERGMYDIRIDILDKIASALDCEISLKEKK